MMLTGAPTSRLSAGHWISAVSASHGPFPCFVAGDRSERTFDQVRRRVNRLARGLTALGVGKGDRVVILATDSIEHVEVVLACLANGAVFCDLNFRLRPSELANIVRSAGPTVVMVGERYMPLAIEITAGVNPQPVLVGIESITSCAHSVESLIDGQPDDSEVDVLSHGEDIVSIAYTSGTTGVPKGVLQSERMIRSMVYSCIHEARVRPRSFRYNGPPLFHFAGIGSAMYGMVAGATTLILPQFDAPTVLWWMQQGGLRDCLLVPTMLSSLLELPEVTQSDYPELRHILYGGAPMTTTLLQRVMGIFKCEFTNLFGAGTEAGAQATLYPEDHVRALQGRPELLESVGRIIPGVHVRLLDDDLNEVPQGEHGEIFVRSETTMSGYLNQPELTARTVVDGWIRTGDIARLDDEGYLFLASRRTEIIIRGGENVYPSEIESVLADQPGVGLASVVGLADEHWGEIIVAVVTPAAGVDAPDPQALRQACVARLATYKVPQHIIVASTLPTTGMGKVDRPKVRELAAGAMGRSAKSVDISDNSW